MEPNQMPKPPEGVTQIPEEMPPVPGVTAPEKKSIFGFLKKPKINFKLILTLILVIAALTAGGYLYLQNQSLKNQAATTPTPEPSATPDPIAGWRTYTNTTYKYSLKYPPNYKEDATYLDLNKDNPLWKHSVFFYTTSPESGGGEIPMTSVIVWKQDSESLEKWYLNHMTSEAFDSEKIPGDKIVLHFGVTSKEEVNLAGKSGFKFISQTMNGPVQRIIVDNGQQVYEVSLWTNNNLERDPNINNNFDQILSTFKFTD